MKDVNVDVDVEAVFAKNSKVLVEARVFTVRSKYLIFKHFQVLQN